MNSARAQRKRFLDSIDEPEKNWRFSPADIVERGFWKQTMQTYEACLSAPSKKVAPWYVVPADDKENTRLIISRIVLDTFKTLECVTLKSTTSAGRSRCRSATGRPRLQLSSVNRSRAGLLHEPP